MTFSNLLLKGIEMKALYIELAIVWALVAFFNFVVFSMNGSWFSFAGGVCSLLGMAVKIYLVGKEG